MSDGAVRRWSRRPAVSLAPRGRARRHGDCASFRDGRRLRLDTERGAHRGDARKAGVTKIEWQGCGSAPVTLYRVDGGGHVVFGSGSFRPPFFGDDTDDVVSVDVIVDAFAALR